MKKFICLFTALCLLLTLAACGKSEKPAPEAEKPAPEAEKPEAGGEKEENQKPEEPDDGTITAVIKVQSRGPSFYEGIIEVELDREAAPITVDNFVKLAKDGFYDGLTFHRIITGFMIQGGDPKGDGTGGAKETIKGEFAQNGVENPISHVRGVISMARAMDPDSASSQFFIVHEDSTFLDGQYAAFGHVTSGMNFVDMICKDTLVLDSNGTVAPEDQPVIESITIQ